MRVPKRDTGAEQPVVGVKVRKADWTEGVALFGSQMRSTSNGRNPWVEQSRFRRDAAEQWEPDESRGSCPVLRERRGVIPLRHSPHRALRERGASTSR